MPESTHIARRAFIIFAYAVCGLAAIFVFLVGGKVFVATIPNAMAASSTLYPHFCLGGWDHPQNAAGPATLGPDDPASAYSIKNSAILGSSVSAQLFCGYFTSTEKAHPPTNVIITFQWSMNGGVEASSTEATTSQESLSSDSGLLIATSTGFTVTQSTTTPSVSPQTQASAPVTPPATTPQAPAAPAPAAATSTSTTSPQTVVPVQATSSPQAPDVQTPPPSQDSSTTQQDSQPSAPVPAPAPAPSDQTPAPAPASAPSDPGTTVVSPPTSFIERVLSLLATPVYGKTSGDDPSQSNAPLLEVSYSTDGVRWTSVGTVGLDNWKGYTVAVPVSSWADVNRLQIMVSPLPSLDKRPDIYLESMSVKADYSRTVGEAVSDAVAAAADAVDNLIGLGDTPDAPVPDAAAPKPPAPQFTLITHKSFIFSLDGEPTDGNRASIKASASSDGSGLTISGSCSKKYYVILLYRNKNDYSDKPSSFVANEAHECAGGSFTYDLSSLSPDIRGGSYYLLTGEQGDTGSWSPTVQPFPVTIEATTTIETIPQ